jgi:hypothetical protein
MFRPTMAIAYHSSLSSATTGEHDCSVLLSTRLWLTSGDDASEGRTWQTQFGDPRIRNTQGPGG